MSPSPRLAPAPLAAPLGALSLVARSCHDRRHAARPVRPSSRLARRCGRAFDGVIAAAGGRDALVDCSRVRTSVRARSLVAWRLDLPMRDMDRAPRRPRWSSAPSGSTGRASSPRLQPGFQHARHDAVLGSRRRLRSGPQSTYRDRRDHDVVHGGSGNWRPRAARAALGGRARAVDAGHAVLARGGDALTAVQAGGHRARGRPGLQRRPRRRAGRARTRAPRRGASCAAPTARRARSLR